MSTNDAAQIGLSELLGNLNAEVSNLPETTPEVTKPVKAKKSKTKKVEAPVEPTTEVASAPEGNNDAGLATTDPIPEAPAPKVKAEKKPKEPKVKPEPKPRVFFGKNRVGRLEHVVGEGLGKVLLLDIGDADLDADGIAKKSEEVKGLIKGMKVKHQYLASIVIEFAAGKRSSMTPVLTAAMRALSKDHKVSGGIDGTLGQRMLAGGQQKSTVSTQIGVALSVLNELEVIDKSGDEYTPNPKSALLALLSGRMALSFVDFEGLCADQDARDLAALKGDVTDNTESLASVEPSTPETPTTPENVAAEVDDLLSNMMGEALGQAAEATF